jgi:hypothetical protein
MNKIALIGLLIFSTFLVYVSSKNAYTKNIVTVSYDAGITELPLDQLKNLRYLTAQEKTQLFATLNLSQRFSIEKAVTLIQNLNQPYILLWFADHKGNLSTKGTQWNQENIFSRVPSGTQFALVDLAAWKYFSLPASTRENPNNSLIRQSLFSECLLCKNLDCTDRYCMLRSSDFFVWLNQLNVKINTVMPNTFQSLIRTDLRKDAVRFSLREIGYTATYLDVWSSKLQCNLLDADQTQIFPLLQYLEGTYYALNLIEKAITEDRQECNLVFLLPNKEFTYYLLENEHSYFQTFASDLMRIAQVENRPLIPTTLYFIPFGFGTSFYDQPFEYGNETIKTKKELLINLNIKD